jgi:PAS domain S-box-containing protein
VILCGITERKRAEEKLAYQARLREMVNDAIVASDGECRLSVWNAATESLYGWTAAEVLGQKGLEILRIEFPGMAAEAMRETIAETGGWRGDVRQRRKDGTRIPVEVASIALHDANGQVSGSVSVNRCIAGRKRAEEALTMTYARLERMSTSSVVGVVRAAAQESLWKLTTIT